MTEEELHNEAHLNAEHDVRSALYATFHDERLNACRAAVLIEVLRDEFMQIDDIEDVSGIVYSLGQMIMLRAELDGAMLAAEGSA